MFFSRQINAKTLLSRRQALLGLAISGATLLGCDLRVADGTPAFVGIDITGASYGRGFSLLDAHGQRRTLEEFRGKVVMLYFGFVQCPDVCPTALGRAAAVMHELGPLASDVQLIFVTVDPERDTPELLREYMAAFDSRFVALTGALPDIEQTAREFKAYFSKVPTGSSYTMDHTALTYLFDRQGRIRVALRHEQSAQDYLADIRLLLAEKASS
jgi:protein SCO1/2